MTDGSEGTQWTGKRYTVTGSVESFPVSLEGGQLIANPVVPPLPISSGRTQRYTGRWSYEVPGSIMVYRVHTSEQWAWHAELRVRSRQWKTSSLVGVSAEELAAWTGRSPRSLMKASGSPEWPRTTSLKLRKIIDAFGAGPSPSIIPTVGPTVVDEAFYADYTPSVT